MIHREQPPAWSPAAPRAELIAVGESACERLRYGRDDVQAFRRISDDDPAALPDRLEHERRCFGEVVAPDALNAARLMAVISLLGTRTADGRERVLLGLNFNFAFRRPIFAEQQLELLWRVREVTPSRSSGGWIAQLDGAVRVGRRPCLVARATVLARPPQAPRKKPGERRALWLAGRPAA